MQPSRKELSPVRMKSSLWVRSALLTTKPLAKNFRKRALTLFIVVLVLPAVCVSQAIKWSPDGNSFYRIEQQEIVEYMLPSLEKKTFISKQQLTPAGQREALDVKHFVISPDGKKVLLFTNTMKVWRINTRGDYWVLDRSSNALKKLGASRPASSLMFAQFSPHGSHVAYISEYNIYVEDLATNNIRQLTTDGNRKFINGTFDWVYEEEFACRDGIRWSPDSRSIAYWQIDARDTRDFYMINNTDSVYSKIIPVEYPKVGQNPSACKIGVVDISSAQTTWMNIPGDPRQHYIVRLEFIPGTNEFIVQQLNRKQNESKLIRCNAGTGAAAVISHEQDKAWVDVYTPASAENAYAVDFKHAIDWLNGGKEFVWASEKNGWRHLYRISTDGKSETQITRGDFDVIAFKGVDERAGQVYFLASPANATQKYLYKTKLDGKDKMDLVTPPALTGTHNYSISPTGKFAHHVFNNTFTRPINELVSLPQHKPLSDRESIERKLSGAKEDKTVEFFKIRTEDGVEMDGWMVKPPDFNPSKKYPVLFYVYTEPWGQNVTDTYGVAQNFMYGGDMQQDGYIYISLITAVPQRQKAAHGGKAYTAKWALSISVIRRWQPKRS